MTVPHPRPDTTETDLLRRVVARVERVERVNHATAAHKVHGAAHAFRDVLGALPRTEREDALYRLTLEAWSWA